MKTQSELITDEQTLTGATSRFGHAIPVYDDGWGQLFIHRDSMGISGIVRAQTWEDAYSICEDEFFPAAEDEHLQWVKEYGENYVEDGAWCESYGFRNNSRKEADGTFSTIYAKDLNGDWLHVLTPALLAELEITLQIEEPEPEPEPHPEWHLWHMVRRLTRNGHAMVYSWSGRYGTQGSKIGAGAHMHKRTLARHDAVSPTWATPSFNPEA